MHRKWLSWFMFPSALICALFWAGLGTFSWAQTQYPALDPPHIESKAPDADPESTDSSLLAQPIKEWTLHKTADNQHPDGAEQQMLWLINRARSDPREEGVWLATSSESDIQYGRDFFNVDTDLLQQEFAGINPAPPAAFDRRLYLAAYAHSLDLISRDAQDHNQQFDRIDQQGFSYTQARGNVFSFAENALNAHAALNIDWGPGDSSGMQPGRGHRLAIMAMDGDYTNTGIAAVEDSVPTTGVGPLVVTQNFCKADSFETDHYNRFLVGTVWEDANANARYDPGEGIAQVKVRPAQGTYYAVTADSGGFALPLTVSGQQQVSFSGSALLQDFQKSISVAQDSVLLDIDLNEFWNGDVAPLGSRDGVVNVADALVCLRFALGLETPTAEDVLHGDVAPLDGNGQPDPDGQINVADALVILRKALGLASF